MRFPAVLFAVCVATPASAEVAGHWQEIVRAAPAGPIFTDLAVRGDDLIATRGSSGVLTVWTVRACAATAKRALAWRAFTPQLPPHAVTFDVLDRASFVSDGEHLYRAGIGAKRWDLVGGFPAQSRSLGITAISGVLPGPTAIYATDGLDVFSSIDGGRTFAADALVPFDPIGSDDSAVYQLDVGSNAIVRIEPPQSPQRVLDDVNGDVRIVASGATVVAYWPVRTGHRVDHFEARTTTDHGATWNAAAIPATTSLALRAGDHGTFVAFAGGHVLTSGDGVTFDEMSRDGLPTTFLSGSATCAGRLVLLFADGSVYAFSPRS